MAISQQVVRRNAQFEGRTIIGVADSESHTDPKKYDFARWVTPLSLATREIVDELEESGLLW